MRIYGRVRVLVATVAGEGTKLPRIAAATSKHPYQLPVVPGFHQESKASKMAAKSKLCVVFVALLCRPRNEPCPMFLAMGWEDVIAGTMRLSLFTHSCPSPPPYNPTPVPLQPRTTYERCGPHRYDAKTAGGSSVADEAAIGRTAKGAQGDTLVASHVGDMDMVRIREAEKIIDTDEVAFGKYIMDEVREKGARPLYALRA